MLLVASILMAGCSLLPGSDAPDEGEAGSAHGSDRGDSPGSSAPAGDSDAGGGPSSSGASTTTAGPATAGQSCGENNGWVVMVAQGTADCASALSVVRDYEDTPDVAPGGRPGNPETVQGWACEPIVFARHGSEPSTYSTWCEREGAALITVDASLQMPAVGPIRKPTALARQGLGRKEVEWGFTTPSGSWYCAIVDNPFPEDGLEKGAHCFALGGSIPGTSAYQPGGFDEATAVSLVADEGIVEAYYSGDLALNVIGDPVPQTLGYGEIDYARGGACTVAQETGVTCTMSGHSFTVSVSNGLTSG